MSRTKLDRYDYGALRVYMQQAFYYGLDPYNTADNAAKVWHYFCT